ncbi:hypothetical protein BaRGS_00000657 [Batillaria attramentaria]|uniref:Uncharacterized protein n=1 Tax=Batillaria attramentaria TaxID=370345 RepID=A0ABD0M991_9CAEN
MRHFRKGKHCTSLVQEQHCSSRYPVFKYRDSHRQETLRVWWAIHFQEGMSLDLSMPDRTRRRGPGNGCKHGHYNVDTRLSDEVAWCGEAEENLPKPSV